MKLNHINLTVTGLAATSTFLQTYFGLQNVGSHTNMTFLRDDDGSVISLTGVKTEVQYPASFHVGFIQESDARVNEINQRLHDDGFEVKAPAHIHGAWTFYFKAPGGFTVEVLSLRGFY